MNGGRRRIPDRAGRDLLRGFSADAGVIGHAVLLAALEQTDAAFARLDQAKRVHDDRLVLIAVDPLLDSLRAVMDAMESGHTIPADSLRDRH